MPITKATGYKASDGVVYADVEMAQRAELKAIFKGSDGVGGDYTPEEVVTDVLTYRDQIMDVLTTGPRSRPGARKKAGTTQPKRAARRAAPATPEQAQVGFTEMRAATDQAA